MRAAWHAARLVHGHQDRPPGDRLRRAVFAGQELPLCEPTQGVVLELGDGAPGQLVRQDAAEVAVHDHTDHTARTNWMSLLKMNCNF